jgi:hypothetical protein
MLKYDDQCKDYQRLHVHGKFLGNDQYGKLTLKNLYYHPRLVQSLL